MAVLVIILGSPASGKTTLACRLGRELALPILCKDDVKEALLDALGRQDRAGSRLLSEASFGALCRLAGTQLAAGQPCILEGNWRPAHAPALAQLSARHGARCAQIRCTAAPAEIERRFRARTRHPGHLDSQLAQELFDGRDDASVFLDLDGPRLDYVSDSVHSYAELVRRIEIRRL